MLPRNNFIITGDFNVNIMSYKKVFIEILDARAVIYHVWPGNVHFMVSFSPGEKHFNNDKYTKELDVTHFHVCEILDYVDDTYWY